MLSRRQVLYGGLGAVAAGLWPGRGGRFVFGQSIDHGASFTSSPLKKLPKLLPSVDVGGYPFARGLTGDPHPTPHLRFPRGEEWFTKGPPPPTEQVDIAIIGGGISGLSTAYLLREHDPVVFELGNQFGGSARGEEWNGVPYSLGGAYVITPDSGTFLDQFYSELGLVRDHRLDEGAMEIELNGDVLRDEFWSGKGFPKEERLAFQRYAEVVSFMANENYPEIPLPKGKENDWILALDRKTLKQDIRDQMGVDVPPLLAGAVQAYCYSSFGAGWEEISAASGWNFLAAEEFGRWVCAGGNAQMATRLWQKIRERETPTKRLLRDGALVVDVRLHPDGVQVTWADRTDRLHSLIAQRVVMACPKNVARNVLSDLERLDPEKYNATQQLGYRGYLVANVLLDAPVERDYYDIFLLGDGNFPTNEQEAQEQSRVIDVLNGNFYAPGPRNVLTLYWPLPFAFGQHTLLRGEETWTDYSTRLAPQVTALLELLEVPASSVRQVRMTSFGHGMPIAYPGFIANGIAEAVRRPFAEKIFFVQQDNWALPAVENCLLDAEHFAPMVAEGL